MAEIFLKGKFWAIVEHKGLSVNLLNFLQSP